MPSSAPPSQPKRLWRGCKEPCPPLRSSALEPAPTRAAAGSAHDSASSSDAEFPFNLHPLHEWSVPQLSEAPARPQDVLPSAATPLTEVALQRLLGKSEESGKTRKCFATPSQSSSLCVVEDHCAHRDAKYGAAPRLLHKNHRSAMAGTDWASLHSSDFGTSDETMSQRSASAAHRELERHQETIREIWRDLSERRRQMCKGEKKSPHGRRMTEEE